MFRHLLESRPVQARSRSAAFISLLVHAAVIGGAVGATQVVADAAPTATPHVPPIYISTPEPAPAAPAAPQPPVAPVPAPAPEPTPVPPIPVPTEIPTTIAPPSDRPAIPPELTTFTTGTPGRSGGDPTTAPGTSSSGGDAGAMWAEEVTRAAAPIGLKRQPRYPDLMRSARTEGVVVATFVVDTLGRVEPSSFRADANAQPAFVQAVRTAVLAQRFRPAEWKGGRVRQLVEQQFVFRLER